MSASIVKAYTDLPDYADVSYVDRKLRVARMMLRRQDLDLRRRWLETVDILLDQRAALARVKEGKP